MLLCRYQLSGIAMISIGYTHNLLSYSPLIIAAPTFRTLAQQLTHYFTFEYVNIKYFCVLVTLTHYFTFEYVAI